MSGSLLRGNKNIEAIGTLNEKNNAILKLMLQHGLDLDKMEGGSTLKEMIESFENDELNKTVREYYHSRGEGLN